MRRLRAAPQYLHVHLHCLIVQVQEEARSPYRRWKEKMGKVPPNRNDRLLLPHSLLLMLNFCVEEGEVEPGVATCDSICPHAKHVRLNFIIPLAVLSLAALRQLIHFFNTRPRADDIAVLDR